MWPLNRRHRKIQRFRGRVRTRKGLRETGAPFCFVADPSGTDTLLAGAVYQSKMNDATSAPVDSSSQCPDTPALRAPISKCSIAMPQSSRLDTFL